MSLPDTGPPRAATPPGVEAPAERFDDLLGRLRGLVDKLESGNLPLEDGLRFFEEGMSLCRKGADILDRAEKRVEVLLSSPESGNPRTAPFEDSPRATDEDPR